jgi:hypothetical protein
MKFKFIILHKKIYIILDILKKKKARILIVIRMKI